MLQLLSMLAGLGLAHTVVANMCDRLLWLTLHGVSVSKLGPLIDRCRNSSSTPLHCQISHAVGACLAYVTLQTMAMS